MKVQVRGDHIDVTDAMRTYVARKIGRLDKYFDAPPEKDISVTMWVERGRHGVEVMLQVHGVLFRAEEETQDMYASVDLVVDKLEEQLHRHKEKLNQKFRSRGLRTRIKSSADNGAFNISHPEFSSSEDVVEGSNLSERVVRIKRFPVKPMDVEEAVMQMELLGHDFFVFTNADTEETNVLYRRKDGDYGLIESARA